MRPLRVLGLGVLIILVLVLSDTDVHAHQRVSDEASRFARPQNTGPLSSSARTRVGWFAAGWPTSGGLSLRRRPERRTGRLDEGAKHLDESKNSPREDVSPTESKPLPNRDGLINRAYLDASSIVAEDNSCSQFFGGPEIAFTVLTELAGQLHRTRLDSGVGIRMSGPYTTVINQAKSLRYRRFERAEVNFAGPFSAHQRFPNEEHVPHVGSFPPNTREARVLMLLHEIGHLIAGPNGEWLLPNDGHDEAQSNKNTLLIEAKCGAQIRALHKR